MTISTPILLKLLLSPCISPFLRFKDFQKRYSSHYLIMSELIRDTILGHFLRLGTRQKVLPYEEDRDPSLWKRYVDKEKSGNMAHHGYVSPEDENNKGKDGEEINGNSSDNDESQTEQTRENIQEPTCLRSSRNSSRSEERRVGKECRP